MMKNTINCTKKAIAERLAEELVAIVCSETETGFATVGYEYLEDLISEEVYDDLYPLIFMALHGRDDVRSVDAIDGEFDLYVNIRMYEQRCREDDSEDIRESVQYFRYGSNAEAVEPMHSRRVEGNSRRAAQYGRYGEAVVTDRFARREDLYPDTNVGRFAVVRFSFSS